MLSHGLVDPYFFVSKTQGQLTCPYLTSVSTQYFLNYLPDGLETEHIRF